MKKLIRGKGLHKATAILLTAIMVLSTFAVLPADLFKVSAADTTSERLELDFNNNWKFNLGDESGAYAKAYDDSAWETVELPHDFSISQEFFSSGVEAESGNLPGGTGWYRKMFVMPALYREKSIILNFDGAYKDTYVYVNGKLVGENHYGYNSFSFDISEYLVCNGSTANFIAVKVEHQLPSSRWYSGSGIYRDVTLTITDNVHVDLYGTYVTTPNLESSSGTDGTVNAVVTLDNDAGYEKTVTVETQILDATGAEVGTSASAEVTATAGAQTAVTLSPSLENPTLWNSWDLGTPYIYTLRTTVSQDGTVLDVYDTDFGYRWFKWDADGGFSLNGQNVKLEGVCMHHDQGALGSVQVYDAIYRQVAILKDMGCNAIRTSHGVPSDVFMDVCNELGMLVMNEFFDGWSAYKNSNSNDFGAYFEEEIDTSTNEILNAEDGQLWYEFVITQSVKRDRNDPAVVIWDVGNELTEGATGDTSDYGTIAQNMQEMIDELDPTRPICQGSNGPSNSVLVAVDEFMDVIGGNYNISSWVSLMTGTSDDRSTKPYVGTETASALSTRGQYSTPYYHSVLTMTSAADSNNDINAYDTAKVTWGAVAAEAWYNTIIYDWNSGEFVWTGFDYIGEPTPWNNTTGNNGEGSPVSSYFGIIDTAGFAKDTYYLYRSMWNEHSTTLHLVPGTWDSSELYVDSNGYVDVAVYSNADHIELLGDGNVIATAQSAATSSNGGMYTYQTWTETVVDSSNVNTTEFYTGDGKDLYSQFHVNYSAYSTISVKAYDASGNEITDTVGTKSVSNTTATQVVASTWAEASTTYTADGDSYVYVELEAQDANGNFVSTYNGTITVTVSDDALTIVGVDNGDPVSSDKFQQASLFSDDGKTATIQMFNGKALAILRTNETVDNDVGITFTAENLSAPQGVTVSAVAESGDETTDEFEEVTDQSNIVYEPTIYDKYEVLYNELTDADGGEVDYALYSATPDGTIAVNMDIPDGWYIITGEDDYTGTTTTGVLTHTTNSSNIFATDGSTGVPASTSDTWYFEKQSSGKYYIYYEDDDGTKQYLTISNNQFYVSTAPYTLDVTTDTSGNVTIGFGSTYINYFASESNSVGLYTTPTNLNLYYVDTTGGSDSSTTTTEKNVGTAISASDVGSLDGEYIITGFDGYTGTYAYGAMTHTVGSGGMIPTNESTITADDENIWIFESVTGGYYIYYLDDSGTKNYLTVADGNISTSTTAAVLTVSDDDGDGMVVIGDSTNSYQLNYYGNTQLVGEWNPGTELTIYPVETTTVTTTPTTTTITEVTDASSLNGEYIITGQDDYTGTIAYGAMTYTEGSGGMVPENSSTIEANDNNVWTIEPTTGGYYIYYLDDSGSKVYLNVADNSISTSSTAAVLTISDNGNGKVTIGDSTNSYQLNYYGSAQLVGEWEDGTVLTLYEVKTVTTSANGVTMWMPTSTGENAPPVENGEYVIYSLNYIVGPATATSGSNTGLERVAETVTDNIITTYVTNDWTFTLVDGTYNQYYIQNSEGKYLAMGSLNGSVTLSDTAVALYVYGTDDNRVVIYNGSLVFDNFQDANNMFSCYSGSTTSPGPNQIMTLYSKESTTDVTVSANKQALYEALQVGIQHAPGTYSTASYQTLFDALEAGYEVYENENATDEEIANATTAINTAIAGLAIEHKYFPTTLYKYGYVPDSDTPYADGGNLFNEKTYASMKAIIEADDNLVSQIKTAIDYDGSNGTTWLDGEADAALETAITAYAEIYSLSFTGAPLTGQSSVTEFQKTAWNVWCKTDTQGTGETSDEGASVQGLFSALLTDGVPTDHADYSELPYGNIVDSREAFNTAAGISLTITANGAEATIDALPALQGISVHINDIFGKEDVYVDSSDTSLGYAKKYWDLNFPLVTSTNEYGINTYSYSSYSTEYVFQAEYDDANNTATAELTPVEDWSVNLDSKGAGVGFFPFNYQNGTTTYTGENAIYHYGLTFSTDFYIPTSGTYADGEDIVFDFMGDDDVLVYIDDVLVLDNGGLHGARNASINFTNASVSYQYAMDVTSGVVENTVENATTYAYGATNSTANADELAALEKLNEVRTDGEYHTFTFYFLERGSTDSNFAVSFNIQQASEHVLLHDQTLVLDYGLPVEYYYVQSNDTITEAGKAATIEYIGLLDGNVEVNSVVTFNDPSNLSKTFADNGDTLVVDGLKYGTANMTKAGYINYTPTTLQMTGRDYFYFCASITNDPTYASDTVYYQYERINFIPATSIYYEDNYGYYDDEGNYVNCISFTDGTTADSNDTHGKWTTVGDDTLFESAVQSADLSGDSSTNPYGYDVAYDNCTEYSGYSAQKVTVSAANNTKSGGTNPTVEFDFTGTGFDVISLTDSTTGVFYVEIFNENGERVGKRKVVDTYYGYSYGQLYVESVAEDGTVTTTLDVTDTPAFKTADGHSTTTTTYYTVDGTSVSMNVTYLDVSGNGYTETPTYFDVSGNGYTETPTYYSVDGSSVIVGPTYLDVSGNGYTETPTYYSIDDASGDILVTTDVTYLDVSGEGYTETPTYYSIDDTTGDIVIITDVTYLDVSGNGYTETPIYYDENGDLTTTETDEPAYAYAYAYAYSNDYAYAYAYAYAYGWVESASATGLYQIPVIKINGLDYGTYSVVITPMYTAMFDHNGSGEFNLYVDAIRIYDPAGKDDDIEDSFILQAYKDDNESYPNYLELKDMLIGADSLSEDAATQGVIFIDGIPALDNDLEKYKVAGPNNELYLAKDQAVAFEIWASQVPDEVQLGIKSVQGTPTFNLTYGANSKEKVVNTATEMNYVINSFLPDGGKLEWTQIEVETETGTETYYKTDTVVIQNTATDDSILSITSMKWTFTGVGQYGHYEVTTNEAVQNLNLMATDATINEAYAMMALRDETPAEDDNVVEDITPDDNTGNVEDSENNNESADDNTATDNNDTATDNNGNADNNSADNNTSTDADDKSDNSAAEKNEVVVNEPITVTVTTSTGVTELIIRDENGNVITPEELECVVETIGNEEVKVWTITLTETESGTYTYTVIGEFEDGTVEEQEEIIVTVTTPEEDDGFFAKLAGVFEDIIEFFKNLLAKIG